MFGHGPDNITLVEPEPAVVNLLVALAQALEPRYVIETGCYHGSTSAAIGRVLDGGSMDTMDIDQYSVDLAKEATHGLPVTVHFCSSLDFIPVQPIDFAFLDSGIGNLRTRELQHFTPYLMSNAIIAIHDSRDIAIDYSDLDWRSVNLPTPRGLLLLQRRD